MSYNITRFEKNKQILVKRNFSSKDETRNHTYIVVESSKIQISQKCHLPRFMFTTTPKFKS